MKFVGYKTLLFYNVYSVSIFTLGKYCTYYIIYEIKRDRVDRVCYQNAAFFFSNMLPIKINP